MFIFGACSVYEFDPVSDVFRQYNMFYAFYRLGCGVCLLAECCDHQSTTTTDLGLNQHSSGWSFIAETLFAAIICIL